jgi:hypothetical protein
MSNLGKSAYGRSKQADIEEIECDSCKNNKFCLSMDSSDGEYGSVNLCFDCIQKMFDEYGPPIIKEPYHN